MRLSLLPTGTCGPSCVLTADKLTAFPQPHLRRFARSSVEAKKLVTELLRLADSSAQPVIAGFDSETPVVWGWQDGKMVTLQKPVALLQLSYHPPSSAWVSTRTLLLAAAAAR